MRLLLLVIAATAALAVPAEAADPPALSISVPAQAVLYGRQLTLSGRLSTDASTHPIGIYAVPAGAGRMHWIATVRANPAGYWSLRIRPAASTAYVARVGAVTTPPLRVAVEPEFVVRLGAGRVVTAHVNPGSSLAGRAVELQRATPTGWLTTETAPLDARSEATLLAPLSQRRLTMRVTMAEDAAEPRLRGGSSHPFLVPATSLVLTANAGSVQFGSSAELEGRVSPATPGLPVLILARGYGAGAPSLIATVVPGPDGRFSYPIAPAVETSYRVGWQGLESRAVVVGVHPALSLTRLRSGEIEARISPRIACTTCELRLERWSAGAWLPIDALRLGGSAQLFPAPAASGTTRVRVVLALSERSTGYLRTSTTALSYRALYRSIAAATVVYGSSLTLSGTAPGGGAGERVTVLARRTGHEDPSGATTLLSGRGGHWSLELAPTVATSYTVGYSDGASDLRNVEVRPRLTLVELADGRLRALVAPGPPLRGHAVVFEWRTPGRRWSALGQVRLDRRGAASLEPLAPRRGLVVRVVIPRADAGAGLLGAASRALRYRSR